MPRLRSLSGQDLWDAASGRHILTIVLHREVDKGTLHAIFRQASRYIAEAELVPYFFTE
jgi:hypothetical protein